MIDSIRKFEEELLCLNFYLRQKVQKNWLY